ncbi:uronyl 2-sulfotransferase [Limosa lapponica baueri]|uniref:Uronyl 2-sulfotransferase n=1 Tax=Limosa lapponica baueri TaxID=1758121 RepID=A0A2I0TW69_LIMLA|nr:uronyl 2-sulfotransferase [Limosa lapponica baueri]
MLRLVACVPHCLRRAGDGLHVSHAAEHFRLAEDMLPTQVFSVVFYLLDEDINVCILENYPECSNPRLFYIIPYFCGQHPRCREPGEWALERAKLNVNENFLLVGILEELEDVLLLLERFLPHYFKDVLSIYKNPEHRKLGNLTVTVKKTVPSPEAIQILYQRMRYEYEFYYYVKEQFHLLKRKFGLKSHIRKPRPRPEFFIPSPLETEEPIDDEEEDDEKWLEDIYKSGGKEVLLSPFHTLGMDTASRSESLYSLFLRHEISVDESFIIFPAQLIQYGLTFHKLFLMEPNPTAADSVGEIKEVNHPGDDL